MNWFSAIFHFFFDSFSILSHLTNINNDKNNENISNLNFNSDMQPPAKLPSHPHLSNRDPFAILPEELALYFFNFLSSDDILHSASTDWHWRNAILSCPSFFSTLVIKKNASLEDRDDEAVVAAGANRILKKVLRYTELSQDRLKEVDLLIEFFGRDITLSYRSWEATQLSTIFHLLTPSSHTLKVIKLDLAEPAKHHVMRYYVLHVVSVIQNLAVFKSLQQVVISADLPLGLKSRSTGPKSMEIRNKGAYYKSQESDVDSRRGSTFAALFEEVVNFTQRGIEGLVCESGINASLEAISKLEQSRKSITKIEQSLRAHSVSFRHSLYFILGCPDLIDLFLAVEQPHIPEGQVLEIRVPRGLNFESKLKSLIIDQQDARTKLVMNPEFFQWANGGGLEEMIIFGDYQLQSEVPVSFDGLKSFLPLSSSTLTSLTLDGIALFNRGGLYRKRLDLFNLKSLRIVGGLALIELFLDLTYSCLRELELKTLDECKSPDLDHPKIIRIMDLCQFTLEKVEIKVLLHNVKKVKTKKGNKSVEIEIPKFKEGTEIPSIQNLSSLLLQLDDQCISRHYLPLDYPNLLMAHLPPSSRIPQSVFSTSSSSPSFSRERS